MNYFDIQVNGYGGIDFNKDGLTVDGSHRVAQEDEHVLLFENLRPHRFEVPATTMGFGWTKNLFKKAAYAAPSAVPRR